jgi:cellulose synthase (UDP-forming)
MAGKSRTLIRWSLAATIIYLIWRGFFTLPLEDGGWAIAFGALLLLAEIMGAIEFISICYFMSDARTPDRPAPPQDWYPDVDVFIATHDESLSILRPTILACLAMDYVAGRKVRVHVCDDGQCDDGQCGDGRRRRDEIGKFCAEMGVRHLICQGNKDAKAGNYNNALRETRAGAAPLIANFDADMVPRRDFLMRVVPYFYISPEEAENRKKNKLPPKKIGFVQAPQRFYNPDLFQFNLHGEKDVPNEQDYFFREIQIGRNKCNAAICCGSNVIFSREALEETGGYATGVITEDFATGIQIQGHGYETYAVLENVASGLSPLDMKSLIKQRCRWARGCIQTLYKCRLLLGRKPRLSWPQKMAYWSAGIYWLHPIRRGIYLLSPILFSLFDVPFVRSGLAGMIFFALSTYILQYCAISNLSNGIRSYSQSALYENILSPSLLPAVVMEILGIKAWKFDTTAKKRTEESWPVLRALYHASPHIALSVLNVVSFVCCIQAMFRTGNPLYFFVIFWLLLNFYITSMSAACMLGRKNQREHERFQAPVTCKISWGQQKVFSAPVNDISMSGFAVVLEVVRYRIPAGKPLEILLEAEGRSVRAKGTLINVVSGKNWHRYAFKLDENTAQKDALDFLSRIVHGGSPRLPEELNPDYSVLADWLRNMEIRFLHLKNWLLRSPSQRKNRSQPRFPISPKNIAGMRVLNCSHDFLLLDSMGKQLPQEIEIPISDGCSIKCILHTIRDNGNVLYQITNPDDILFVFFMGGHAETMPQDTIEATRQWEADFFDEKQFL